MLSQALTQFTLRLICGMSLMLAATNYRQTSSGFYRIQMLVVLGLSVLASMFVRDIDVAETESSLTANLLFFDCLGIAVSAFFGSLLWTLERKAGAYRVVLLIAIFSVFWLGMHAWLTADSTAQWWFQTVSNISSGAILGGAMTGMLLGHWYLTAPTMSLDPLLRLAKLFGVAAAIRLLVSTVGLWWGWSEITGTMAVMLLLMRWCFGIIGPLAAFGMTWRILKYRNTQAATGVLFVGVILTFLGELSGILLFFQTGVTF